MQKPVVNGAIITCSFGDTPGTLIVLPEARPLCGGLPVATIFDIVPLENIAPFGLCSSEMNPMVQAATDLADGVLTPMPCIPVVDEPWMPGLGGVLLNSMPALGQNSKCLCQWEGEISVLEAGEEVLGAE